MRKPFLPYTQKLEKHLSDCALITRGDIVEMIAHAGLGHLGGSLSVVEIVTILYECFLRITPDSPEDEQRDRFILSKGHAGPCLYSVLARKGYFGRSLLFTMNEGGTKLPSHVDKMLTPGIDCTTGSLGQGLSVGIGMAYAARLQKKDMHVYVVLSDGECNEGQVWEAAMAAAHYNLANITAFVDYNKLQIDGFTKDVMNLDDLQKKWESFGWISQSIDGHSFSALHSAITAAAETGNTDAKPQVIICNTIKGKGHPVLEGKRESHHLAVTPEDVAISREYLGINKNDENTRN